MYRNSLYYLNLDVRKTCFATTSKTVSITQVGCMNIYIGITSNQSGNTFLPVKQGSIGNGVWEAMYCDFNATKQFKHFEGYCARVLRTRNLHT